MDKVVINAPIKLICVTIVKIFFILKFCEESIEMYQYVIPIVDMIKITIVMILFFFKICHILPF